jgi:cupin fold WbuC family metalloprotein|tara:strand:+ start:125 stop:523 length:399 start_codon:yes stop_codon:yes gene_type:complete
MIENITHNKKNLALIIKNTYLKKKGVNFFTNNKLSQQVAFMSHKKGHLIQPHIHKKRLKKIYDTCEVLIMLEGSLKVNFYNNSKKYLFSKIIKKNDIIILLTGGHGFEILKNCKFIEVKQGPYNPTKDKFKF